MLDSAMRPVKDRLLAPVARTPIGRLPPVTISVVGLAASIGAALAAWQSIPVLAVALWLFGRVADGLDGAVARASGRSSDIGGLLDFVFDTIGYAVIPLGIAFGIDERGTWIATAVLLATFYLNAVSLGYVAALLEKRGHPPGSSAKCEPSSAEPRSTAHVSAHGRSATERASPTSAVLPRGLVEGTETIVFFTLALAFTAAAATIWWVMAVAVLITALERVRWAMSTLR
jgi:phosphatidylglycerophosphate synthase